MEPWRFSTQRGLAEGERGRVWVKMPTVFWRIMNALIQFMGLAPADMARLPHLINTKKFLVLNDLVRQQGLHLL
jgi:hypothetical protein